MCKYCNKFPVTKVQLIGVISSMIKQKMLFVMSS